MRVHGCVACPWCSRLPGIAPACVREHVGVYRGGSGATKRDASAREQTRQLLAKPSVTDPLTPSRVTRSLIAGPSQRDQRHALPRRNAVGVRGAGREAGQRGGREHGPARQHGSRRLPAVPSEPLAVVRRAHPRARGLSASQQGHEHAQRSRAPLARIRHGQPQRNESARSFRPWAAAGLAAGDRPNRWGIDQGTRTREERD